MRAIEKDRKHAQYAELERALGLVHQQLNVHNTRAEDGTRRGEANPVADPRHLASLASKAEAIYKGRRARDQAFAGLDLFGEPVWDIMLDLFSAHVNDRQISVSSAVIGAAVAPTTALRWVSTLVQMNLLERVPDPFDRRRAFIRLTDRGVALTAEAVARARA